MQLPRLSASYRIALQRRRFLPAWIGPANVWRLRHISPGLGERISDHLPFLPQVRNVALVGSRAPPPPCRDRCRYVRGPGISRARASGVDEGSASLACIPGHCAVLPREPGTEALIPEYEAAHAAATFRAAYRIMAATVFDPVGKQNGARRAETRRAPVMKIRPRRGRTLLGRRGATISANHPMIVSKRQNRPIRTVA